MSTVFNFTFVPWFRSVAPYIHMHRGKTFVVAISGEAIAAGKLPSLVQDLALQDGGVARGMADWAGLAADVRHANLRLWESVPPGAKDARRPWDALAPQGLGPHALCRRRRRRLLLLRRGRGRGRGV